MLESISQAIINGLFVGGVYAIIAVGLTLIFGVMGIVNFAHGEFVMLGCYVVLILVQQLGINSYLAIPFVALVMYLLGIIIYKALIIKVQEEEHTSQILLTLGLSYILISVSMMLFSTKHQLLNSPLSSETVNILNMQFGMDWVLGFFFALIVTVAFYFILQHTAVGKKIRAVAQNKEAALLMGINIKKIYTLAFAMGTLSAGIGGALVANIYSFNPTVGKQFILIAFIIVVLGGLGSFWGAFIGALIIGVTQSVATVFMPASLAPVISYIIFVLVLWLRPQGIFSRATRV